MRNIIFLKKKNKLLFINNNIILINSRVKFEKDEYYQKFNEE